ncbi:MAG: hypothetical protein ACFFE8_09235 [Candidatus Heimdallarchaeota archaeon]
MTQEVTEDRPPQIVKKRTLSDNIRAFKYILTTVRANTKFLIRIALRELKYFIPLRDLIILYIWVLMGMIVFVVFLVLILPFVLSLIPGDPFFAVGLQSTLISVIFTAPMLGWASGIIGVTTIVARLMIKSPISKYTDKNSTKKDVTYVFGTSRPAERFLFEMVYQYAYEEKVSLIADADLLWVRTLKGRIDTYVVEDFKEFEKENLYEIIGFQNAIRIMVLTESIELNQNILTNIRKIRPNIDIILLSQHTPAWVFSELVQDPHLSILEDLEVTVEALVTSLSLDFDYPSTVEIDVPRTYIGSTGDDFSADIPRLTILLIRRGDILLPPHERLQQGDRVVIHYIADPLGNYNMMLANRVVTELPSQSKQPKKKNTKDKTKAQDHRSNNKPTATIPPQDEETKQFKLTSSGEENT